MISLSWLTSGKQKAGIIPYVANMYSARQETTEMIQNLEAKLFV